MIPMSTKLLYLVSLVYILTGLNKASFNNSDQINAIVGNESFVTAYGRSPDIYDSQKLRITTHLTYVTDLLEQADVSSLDEETSKKRKHLLELLKKYTLEGNFPSNYDIEGKRSPTFIDKNGNICAVGYLVQQTAGDWASKEINSIYKNEYIANMDSELLDNWLNENGLTKLEAEMIQPTYNPPPSNPIEPPENSSLGSVSTSYSVSSILLTGCQLAFTGMTFHQSNSRSDNIKLSSISAGLGMISVATGVYNYRNSSYRKPGNSSFFNNSAKENLSLFNIIFGTASVAFNGYRIISLYRKDNKGKVALAPAMLYTNENSGPVAGFNVSVNF